MGKYDGVIKKLPKAELSGEPGFREKVEARKRELVELEMKLIGSVKPVALATRYVAARREKDRIAKEESAANLEVVAIEELMHVAFESEGLTSVKLADGSSVSVNLEPTAQVVDQDKLISWAKANGYERMMTLYAQTVGATAKDLLLEGAEMAQSEDGTMTLMDGSVKVSSKMKTTLRKG